jgi:hypothetical protein
MTTIASLPNRLPCLSKDKSFSEGTADTSPRFAFFPRFHTLRDVKCVSNNTLALRHIQHAGRRKKLPSSEIEEVRCCFLRRQEPCMKELRIQALGLLCLLRPLWDSKCVSNNTLILRHIQYTGRRKILRRTRDPFNEHKNFSKCSRTRRSPPLNTKHQTPNTKHQTPNTKHQTPTTDENRQTTSTSLLLDLLLFLFLLARTLRARQAATLRDRHPRPQTTSATTLSNCFAVSQIGRSATAKALPACRNLYGSILNGLCHRGVAVLLLAGGTSKRIGRHRPPLVRRDGATKSSAMSNRL